MRRYSNFQALLYAFFLRDAYRDAARGWKGAGILYTLLLAGIACLAVVVRIQATVSGYARHEAAALIAQLPTITIDRGIVSIDRPGPIIIRDRKGNEVAIIDTTASVAALEGRTAYVLLTRDHLVARKSETESRIMTLERVQHFVLTRERISGWVRRVEALFAVLAAPFILVGIYLARLFQQLLTALVTLLVANVRRVPVDFAATMRLAALAITPATLVLDLLGYVGGRIPFSSWLWCLFTIGYVVFGVNACQAEPAAPAIAETPAPPP
jgi:hypothetical protein